MNFLKKIFSPTILIISLSLLFYTFYRSEINYNGDRRDYYFGFYTIHLVCKANNCVNMTILIWKKIILKFHQIEVLE